MKCRRFALVAPALALCVSMVPAVGVASALALPATDRLLDVPYLPQTADLCGGAAAAMVLRYWGERQVYAEDFAPLVDHGAAGIRTDVLAAAIRQRGWQALSASGAADDDADALRRHVNHGRPVIALIEVAPHRYHYVVLVAIAAEQVILHDPAEAPFRVLARAAFTAAWAAAGHWALLITPAATSAFDLTAEQPTASATTPSSTIAADALTAGAASSGKRSSVPPCSDIVAEMVDRARRGDTSGAEAGLRAAVAWCPASGPAWRELAGVHFVQQRWAEASAAAARAAVLEPDDAPGWDLLATSRFLDGRPDAALDAWNHIGRPMMDLVRVTGARRTRHPVIAALAALPPRTLLTPAQLRRAERRVAALPSAAVTSVQVRPLAGGVAGVDVAVAERPALPHAPFSLALAAARTVIQRGLTVDAVSPTGSGELWTASWRWWEHRPRVAFALAMPSPGRLPGITTVEASWEKQTYALPSALGPSDLTHATQTRAERRRGGIRLADWATDRVHWETGLALDTWRHDQHASLDGAAEVRLARDHGALRAESALWMPIGTGARFATAGLSTSWRSAVDLARPTWLAAADVTRASAVAPYDLWLGAGTGYGRAPLLRAHPLLVDGVVTGAVFGRQLAHATAEYQHPVLTRPGASLRVAVFADAARSWHGVDGAASQAAIDAGIGVRVVLPGRTGTARIDLARGVRDGGTVLSAGWQAPWPDR